MSLLSNIFFSLARLLELSISVYTWLVIIRVILSWSNVGPHNEFVRLLIRVTEPVLGQIRKVVPNFSGLDISPIILIFGLYLLKSVLAGILRNLAISLS